MSSAVCTLFEGHYHHGVAALVNSLYLRDFRGVVYAGYRGELPKWSSASSSDESSRWPGSSILEVANGIQIHFLPLDTDYHFTNYKPDFMLRLWDNLASEAQSIFYFDPDIVVTESWSAFDNWTTYGVALCEDIMSPKPMHHPIRQAWRQYFGKRGFILNFKEAMYANGGFIGVSKQNRDFLLTWQSIQEAMAPAIGGLNKSFFITQPTALAFDPFSLGDQDALNAAIEAWSGPVSFVDKNGMAFGSSRSLMSHAIGSGKPWVRETLAQALNGYPPRRADRDYWMSANGPIVSQPEALIKRRRLTIQVAALIGRFYSRK
jgi:hypothetical protein